jgi:hypothetical protein
MWQLFSWQLASLALSPLGVPVWRWVCPLRLLLLLLLLQF